MVVSQFILTHMRLINLVTGAILVILTITQLYAQSEDFRVTSFDGLNELWVGVANPVFVKVKGVSHDKLRVSISNGSIVPDNDHYIANVGKGTNAIIEVSEEQSNGSLQFIGKVSFRVKQIPNPMPCIGKSCKTNVNITKDELLNDPELRISFDLPFSLGYTVASYSCTLNINGNTKVFKVFGSRLSDEAVECITLLTKGNKIYIDNIIATGPDGREVFFQPVTVILQ